MKQHYISAKRLSLWMRLVKRWKSLYRTVAQGASETKLSKLNKLSLTLGIKRKIAIGSLATMATVGAQAQVSFEEVLFGDNQVLPSLGIINIKPVFVDLDGDNDKDLVIGTTDGSGIHYYTNTNNVFKEKVGTENLFNDVNISLPISANWINPTFVDFDNDGDLDLVIGEGRFAKILYFTNDGNNVFTEQKGANNPFSTIATANDINLAFGDLDQDGDQDVFTGNRVGELRYYKNTNNVFTEQTGTDFPLNINDIGLISDPVLVDTDGDNDLDLLAGTNVGILYHFVNDGTGKLKSDTGVRSDIGFGGIARDALKLGRNLSPTFVDFDEDNDIDLVVGTNTGDLFYFANNNGAYEPDNTSSNIFAEQVKGAFNVSPEFYDVDGDNDLDAIIGNDDGTISYFKNNAGTYTSNIPDTLNPFSGIKSGRSATPTVVDFNKDGTLDLVIGSSDGTFYLYEDSSGVFIEKTGVENPFDGLDVGGYSSPTFVDLDKDGDLDLVSSEYDNALHYYKNEAGVFTEKTGADNFFDGLSLGYKPSPTFADLDGDGDLDLVVGEYYGNGTINYFSNDGGNNFTKEIGTNNPFEGIDAGSYIDPTFADLDGDGDSDLVLGTSGGNLIEYRNTSVVGLSELIFTKKEKTTVYPNPASNQLFVETEGNYQISDATGVVLLEGKVSKNGIDVSNLNDGYYVINVAGKTSSFIKR